MIWLSDESVNLWEILGDCEMTMSWSRWLWEDCEILVKSLWDNWQWDDCKITVRWLWDDCEMTMR